MTRRETQQLFHLFRKYRKNVMAIEQIVGYKKIVSFFQTHTTMNVQDFLTCQSLFHTIEDKIDILARKGIATRSPKSWARELRYLLHKLNTYIGQKIFKSTQTTKKNKPPPWSYKINSKLFNEVQWAIQQRKQEKERKIKAKKLRKAQLCQQWKRLVVKKRQRMAMDHHNQLIQRWNRYVQHIYQSRSYQYDFQKRKNVFKIKVRAYVRFVRIWRYKKMQKHWRHFKTAILTSNLKKSASDFRKKWEKDQDIVYQKAKRKKSNKDKRRSQRKLKVKKRKHTKKRKHAKKSNETKCEQKENTDYAEQEEQVRLSYYRDYPLSIGFKLMYTQRKNQSSISRGYFGLIDYVWFFRTWIQVAKLAFYSDVVVYYRLNDNYEPIDSDICVVDNGTNDRLFVRNESLVQHQLQMYIDILTLIHSKKELQQMLPRIISPKRYQDVRNYIARTNLAFLPIFNSIHATFLLFLLNVFSENKCKIPVENLPFNLKFAGLFYAISQFGHRYIERLIQYDRYTIQSIIKLSFTQTVMDFMPLEDNDIQLLQSSLNDETIFELSKHMNFPIYKPRNQQQTLEVLDTVKSTLWSVVHEMELKRQSKQ